LPIGEEWTTRVSDVPSALELIRSRRARESPERALLVGVTGIDGSGKGYLAAQMAHELRQAGTRVAVINADGWLNLPSRRFGGPDPGRHFYEHALRFEEMFARLALPLKAARSLRLEAELSDPTGAEVYRRHVYEFTDLDVILLEGIFLLKRAHRGHFDLSFWIDCTFETALERALQRGQEGLPPEETVRDYETVYFPAQRIHLAEDGPRVAASAVLINDPRLLPPAV
jgi:uridine kinase